MECSKNEYTQCRNCGRAKVNRPRGLCWTCYYTPGVKDRFPSTSKYARRGVANITGNAPLPTVPTEALPGSLEKLQILSERARLKQSLWHPLDATLAPAAEGHGEKRLAERSSLSEAHAVLA